MAKQWRTRRAIAGMLTLLALSACGRAGYPEAPASEPVASASAPAGDQETEDKRFVLDALLN